MEILVLLACKFFMQWLQFCIWYNRYAAVALGKIVAINDRTLTHWPLGDLDAILKLQFSILFYSLVSSHHLRIIDDKSTLVQVMAWCQQATSHYLSPCWPGSTSPYGVTRPQGVNDSKRNPQWNLNCEPTLLVRWLFVTCLCCSSLNCQYQLHISWYNSNWNLIYSYIILCYLC